MIAPFTQLGENPAANQLFGQHRLDVLREWLQLGVGLGWASRVIRSGRVTQIPAYCIA